MIVDDVKEIDRNQSSNPFMFHRLQLFCICQQISEEFIGDYATQQISIPYELQQDLMWLSSDSNVDKLSCFEDVMHVFDDAML